MRRAGTALLVLLVSGIARADPAPAPCTLTGAPTTLATTRRNVSWVGAAAFGDERTVVWWTDGGTSKLGVVDAAGALAGGELALDAEGGVIMDAKVTPTGDRFVVTYVHKHGPRWQHCDLVGRPWAPPAAPGPPTVLASNVCSQSGYPVVAFREGFLFAAYTVGYEGTGLHVLVWSPGHEPVDHLVVPGGILTQPLALAGTRTGLTVLWGDEGETTHAQDLTTAGAPSGPAIRVRLPAGVSAALLPTGPVRWQKTRTGVRFGPLDPGAPPRWTDVDLGTHPTAAALFVDGASIGVLGLARNRVPRWVLLDTQGAAQGGPIALPRMAAPENGARWPAPVRRGRRASVVWADHPGRALRWQRLECR